MIEALLELQFAEPDRAKQFQCQTCPNSIKKIRRCEESREDFTMEDGNIWPMRVQEGGSLFGFCPAKASRNPMALLNFKALMVCFQTGLHWQIGGISEQPEWWIDLVYWFTSRYDDLRFYSRAKAILGDGKNGSHKKSTGISNKAGNPKR